ncbi:MAG: hypothetical protein LBP25_01850, partial [Tannerellaceae bacterium]|nr:hypothetical protein [Tannerellaceae bacterium]
PRPADERTPAPVATEAPAYKLSQLSAHRIQIDYYDGTDETPKRAKPEGQHGVEIRWNFSDTPVTDAEDLTNSVFDTATPAILSFSGHDHGRTLYLALRWENSRGEKGPWSTVTETYVP